MHQLWPCRTSRQGQPRAPILPLRLTESAVAEDCCCCCGASNGCQHVVSIYDHLQATVTCYAYCHRHHHWREHGSTGVRVHSACSAWHWAAGGHGLLPWRVGKPSIRRAAASRHCAASPLLQLCQPERSTRALLPGTDTGDPAQVWHLPVQPAPPPCWPDAGRTACATYPCCSTASARNISNARWPPGTEAQALTLRAVQR